MIDQNLFLFSKKKIQNLLCGRYQILDISFIWAHGSINESMDIDAIFFFLSMSNCSKGETLNQQSD